LLYSRAMGKGDAREIARWVNETHSSPETEIRLPHGEIHSLQEIRDATDDGLTKSNKALLQRVMQDRDPLDSDAD